MMTAWDPTMSILDFQLVIMMERLSCRPDDVNFGFSVGDYDGEVELQGRYCIVSLMPFMMGGEGVDAIP